MSLLIGPFTQILPMTGLPKGGPIKDEDMSIIYDGGLLIRNGFLEQVDSFDTLKDQADEVQELEGPAVCLPGFVDAHTHICYAGSRARDYALRLSGVSYQEIAAQGGGILSTVRHTRQASEEELVAGILGRCVQLQEGGITTAEVKSGYGLTVADELKMLRAIRNANEQAGIDLIPTCLGAHTLPWEFDDREDYLKLLENELLPKVVEEGLSRRVDIFVEEGAFSVDQARPYLLKAKELGFDITIHADQFSRGASLLAGELGALSADHLEVSGPEDFEVLKQAGVHPVVLPGASLGLGLDFAPARSALDTGLPLAIASDWNPGSAPMGDLLTQAALLGANQHLTMAETLAGISTRAAAALGLSDRGRLAAGLRADFTSFPCSDYREILYYQGSLRPFRPTKARG